MTSLRTRRSTAAAIAVAALAVIALAVWLLRRPPAPGAVQTAPPVPTAIVREGRVDRTIALTGRIGVVAGTQVKLAFALPGTVRAVTVRLGERVAAGTALAALDATGYALNAQQADADAQAAAAAAAAANVDRTSVKLRVDRAELERQQRLYAAGIVALRDVQAAQAALATDDADAQSARDQLAAARAQARSASAHAGSANYDLDRTVLRAPHDGIVSGIYVQAGDAVDASTPVVALAPAQQHLATLDVPVQSAGALAPGDLVRADAAGTAFEGRVQGIAPAVDPATGLAVLDVTGVPDGIAAGTPVDASVVVGSTRGLVVPRAAIVEDPQTGKTMLFVERREAGGAAHFDARTVEVAPGSTQSADVVVLSGVHAGERVASQGAIDLLAPAGGG